MSNSPIPVVVIFAPTASGKTALTRELFCGKGSHFILNAEIISADSQAVYKGMDIGTAKPEPDFCREIPHHLIDLVNPDQQFSVADFVEKSDELCREIYERGKLPVVCGGTGQYISALLYGLDYGSGDEEAELRATKELEEEFERSGIDVLYERLVQVDPEAAKLIHPNNTRRVIRALAVYKALGITFSEKNRKSKDKGPEYPFKVFMIDWDREDLYDRINRRVDIMIENGIIDEARLLIDSGVDRSSTCWQAIGYKEMLKYLEGEESIEQAADRIRIGTRHYAKRQLTWFRRMGDDVTCIKPDEAKINAKRVMDLCIKDVF
jgi:tRNA dimethylallyltransferase